MHLVTFLPPWQRHQGTARRDGAEIFPADRTFLARAREVIAPVFESLRIRVDDEVLMPGSICWDALSAVLACGVRVRSYPLDSMLRADPDTLSRSISVRTRAIYLVHYFGFPQDGPSIRRICDERGVAVIEDCALCPPTVGGVGGEPYVGDVTFHSLWKVLAISDGAVTFGPGTRAMRNPHERIPLGEQASRLARLAYRTAKAQGCVPSAVLRRRMTVLSRDVEQRPSAAVALKPRRITALSRAGVSTADWETLNSARRRNFEALLEGLGSVRGVTSVWTSLPKCVVPYAFPLIVRDPITLQRELLCAGVESELSINRPDLANTTAVGRPADYADLDFLAAHVLCLPVHQGVAECDVGRMVVAVRAAVS